MYLCKKNTKKRKYLDHKLDENESQKRNSKYLKLTTTF